MEAKLKTYSVKDWGKLYENNRTRDLVEMKWVPVPNRHDGDGYTTLVCREDGAAMLGCWLAILQVASKCEPRGTLIRHNPAGGCGIPAGKCGEVPEPHTAATLSRITRLPEKLIEKALGILENECKWLISNIPQEGAGIPQEGAGKPHPSAYGKEGNGKEEKREGGRPLDESFAELPSWEEFWAYCQSHHCGLSAEWFARDKWEAAEQDRWSGKSNWRAYARRCRSWWQQDGCPKSRPDRLNRGQSAPQKTIQQREAEKLAKEVQAL